MFMFIELPV